MSRPLRLEYPGALYHITSRGVEKRPTFLDDEDRRTFLYLLSETVRRFGWIVSAYVLMTNHFHMLIQLTKPKLSAGLQWLNGEYVRRFNRRHDRAGTLFQSRPDAPLVEKEAYYLNVLRYIVRNPVRAKMVAKPGEYEWSSYRSTAGLAAAPSWLAVDEVLRCFGNEEVVARHWYRAFVEEPGADDDNPWRNLVGQIYLGSPDWLERVQGKIDAKPRNSEHPVIQRHLKGWVIADVIDCVAGVFGPRGDALRQSRGGTARMLTAWVGSYECLLPLGTIAAGLRLRSTSHVSRMIRRCDQQLRVDPELRERLEQCRAALYDE